MTEQIVPRVKTANAHRLSVNIDLDQIVIDDNIFGIVGEIDECGPLIILRICRLHGVVAVCVQPALACFDYLRVLLA